MTHDPACMTITWNEREIFGEHLEKACTLLGCTQFFLYLQIKHNKDLRLVQEKIYFEREAVRRS